MQVLHCGERFGKRGGQKVGRDRGTDHQGQGVFILGHEGGEAGDVHPRRVDAGLGLMEIQRGRHPCLIAAADELVGCLLARQGVLGEFQPFAVGGQGQVVCRNLGDQADLHAPPGLSGGEKLLQGLVLEAPHPAEQVEFIGAHAEADIVLMDVHGESRPGKVFRQTLVGGGGVGIDLREQIGALDLVLGPGPLYVQRCHAQVAVIGQGQTDQLLQLRVNKKLAPLQVCGCRLAAQGGAVLVGRAGGPGGGNRRFRPGIFRRHAATGQTGDTNAYDCNSADHVRAPPSVAAWGCFTLNQMA